MDGELQELFNYAISKGVNLFDTADSYGSHLSKVTAKTSHNLKRLAKSLSAAVAAGTGRLNGRSEQLLGRFIAESSARKTDDVLIATKLAAYPWRVTPGQYVSACR